MVQSLRRPRRVRWAIVTLIPILLIALASAVVVAWTRTARYPAHPEALAAAARAERVSGWYVFAPEGEARAGVIVYPGGLVDAAAYAGWAESLQAEGLLAVITPMPLELAVLAIDRAAAVMDAFPATERWFLAGHSLGGAMAAEYAARNPGRAAGLLLLGAYPATGTDLSLQALAVATLLGSEDGVTNRETFDGSLQRLPVDAVRIVIDGGNHAQFGDYGPQRGDGVPRITGTEQQRHATEALLALLQAER
jgi:hypothetical protein